MVVYKKKNGKFYCRFQINGERKNLVCNGATNIKEAEKIEQGFKYKLQQQQNGIIPREKNIISFDKLCNLYWEYALSNNKDLKHVKSKIKYFKEYFGKQKMIDKILNVDIIKYKNALIQSGKKPATVNKYISSLKKMFNLAIKNGYLEKNPCDGVEKMIEDNIQIKFWTKEEEERFLQACPDWFRDIIIMALNTGLRKSNIRLMKKSWINLEENLIQIPKTCNKGKKFIEIPMNVTVLNICKKYWNDNEIYLFVNKQRKTTYSDDTLRNWFNTICTKTNVKNIGFHGLRHTVGTRLAEQNIDVVVIKDWLAHSSLSTTQRYVHSSKERMNHASNILNSYTNYSFQN